MAVEMTLRPNFPDSVADRINRLKNESGITKTHMTIKAFEMYLDVMEGKAKFVPVEPSNPEARSAS